MPPDRSFNSFHAKLHNNLKMVESNHIAVLENVLI